MLECYIPLAALQMTSYSSLSWQSLMCGSTAKPLYLKTLRLPVNTFGQYGFI